jgi:hypothetical protein
MKKVLAIDPGVNGGWALGDSLEITSLKSFTTEIEFIDFLSSNEIDKAVIEDVPAFVSSVTSNASSFKLGYNYGFEVGAIRAQKISLDLVKPRIWQAGIKGLKPKMGYAQRKRLLADAARRIFPDQKVTQKNADALLILNWYYNSK